jgi:hypothetical protein
VNGAKDGSKGGSGEPAFDWLSVERDDTARVLSNRNLRYLRSKWIEGSARIEPDALLSFVHAMVEHGGTTWAPLVSVLQKFLLEAGKAETQIHLFGAEVRHFGGRETHEALPASSQYARREFEELKERVSQLESLMQASKDERAEVTGAQMNMEQEIENIVREGPYERLYDVLASDRKTVLDVICRRTAKGDISLDTDDGKQVWRIVVNFHSDNYQKELNSVYSRLADCSGNALLKGIHGFIYNALFAVSGGVTADVEAGYWAADRYARHLLSRQLFK